MGDLVLGLIAGTLIAAVTAPVGVSGAVFLLPVQLSVLQVPNPAVTPTNLLYNVVAGPGALLRTGVGRVWSDPLARRLLAGSVPGVIVGSVVRVLLVPGPTLFRLVAGLVLLALGSWLLCRTWGPPVERPPLSDRATSWLALAVGVIGGVYGIGGGSILSPVLVGSGVAVAVVAPAALASTFVTSVVGSLSFVALSLLSDGAVAPDWSIGISCGLGGLLGGYVGARLQPRVPELALRTLLGLLAVGIGATYLVQGVLR